MQNGPSITPERTALPKALAGTAQPKARLALGGVGAVLLLCALIGTFIHPELPPEFASLTRSDEVSSSVGKGPQFCGRSGGRALGHAGSWVVELWIGGHEHCVVAYPKSAREEGLFSSLPARPSLTAWHTSTMVWQVQGPGGMLVDYATRRAEAEEALGHHRTRQAVLLGAGLLACAAGVGLGRRARRSQPGSHNRGTLNRISTRRDTMKNERPDGQSIRTLLESALAQSLGARSALVSNGARHGAPDAALAPAAEAAASNPIAGSPVTSSPVTSSPATSSPIAGSPVVVGEILDTHHPHLPGRVLVRWWPSAGAERSEWLHHERHLTLARGDRVLVTLPLGWAEWLVTGALGRASAVDARVDEDSGAHERSGAHEHSAASAPSLSEGAPRLQLEPGQALVVVGHDGQPLLQVRQAPDGLRLELVRDQIEIKAQRRLRLSADSIEIAAGPGGVDVRTEGDAVTRARAIRLN